MNASDPPVAAFPAPTTTARVAGGQSYAAIDLGSNSFHLIVARLEHGSLNVIDRIKEMVRLAGGVNAKGRLDPAVEQRALDCLARFGQRLSGVSPGRVAAVGTNALRRLRDGWHILSRMEAALGHRIEVISGEEEARLIYLGVAQGISAQGRQRLVIDIGGGSTEFVIGRERQALRVKSLFFGCVAVAAEFFAKGKLTAKRWAKAKAAVAIELQRVSQEFKTLGWQEVLGSSGTMRAVRNVMVAGGWSSNDITPAAMDRLRQAAIEAGRVDRLSFEGLSERRRPVFAGGAVIIDACLEVLDIERIAVTEYALREGLLYQLIGRSEHADLRRVTITALQRKYRVDQAQSERLRVTALDFFRQLQGHWEFPEGAGDWLEFAACVHELGLTIAHHGYHRHGAYLLSHSDLPGFSRRAQLVVATLVLNHRRKPDLAACDRLPKHLRPSLLRLIAVLRLAALFCRNRTVEVAPVKLAIGERKLLLSFPGGWLQDHPLTAEDLRQERKHLKKLGVSLATRVAGV